MGHFTATAALARMREEQLTATQFLQTCLDRIEQRESVVKAWTFLAPEAAQQQALDCDTGDSEGDRASPQSFQPLHGIPVAVKDIFATVDMPTAWGTPIYAGRYLTEDADVVTRLKAAGAIILGKTVTTELATAAAGPTRNPHNLAHTPGGSSSGSAAAVADGMVPIAIGSQTMGSVLRPAAYCGIFGFKPSFGAISRRGMMPVCDDLDHVGLFARSLADMQHLLTVLTVDPADWVTGAHRQQLGTAVRAHSPAPLRSGESIENPPNLEPQLAWVKTPHWHQVEPVAQSQLTQTIAVLKQTGIAVETVALPPVCHDYWDTVQMLCAYGLNAHQGALLERFRESCSPQLKDWLQRGQLIQPAAYEQACQRGACYREAITSILEQYDAILTPVTTGPAPYGLATTGSPLFCGLWTLCGTPALNLPIGRTAQGLPLGCQLVGRWGEDESLLHTASRCWQVLQTAFGRIQLP